MQSAPHLDALWLRSFGRGEADAFSDLDLVAVVAADHQAGFVQGWRVQVERLVPIVLWYGGTQRGAAHNATGREGSGSTCCLSTMPARNTGAETVRAA